MSRKIDLFYEQLINLNFLIINITKYSNTSFIGIVYQLFICYCYFINILTYLGCTQFI